MFLFSIALAVVLIGVAMLSVSQLRRATSLRRYRYYLAGGGAVLLIAGLFGALLGLNIRDYTPLDGNRIIATVRVKALYPVAKTYAVTITRRDGTPHSTTCILQGDEMGLGGRAQLWRNWSALLGHHQTYALDRAVSRYYHFLSPRIGAEPITSCTIHPKRPKVDYYLPGALVDWITDLVIAHQRPLRPLSFVPLTDGAAYDMEITPQGIAPRPHRLTIQAV